MDRESRPLQDLRRHLHRDDRLWRRKQERVYYTNWNDFIAHVADAKVEFNDPWEKKNPFYKQREKSTFWVFWGSNEWETSSMTNYKILFWFLSTEHDIIDK